MSSPTTYKAPATTPAHVAIVGCGFTGTTALHQLVHHYPVERITVFESSGYFGPGFPYRRDESPEYLLNNSNDTMCLEPGNRRAFVDWLHRHPVYATDLDEKASMPRAVYGEFLRDVIRQALANADKRCIKVELIAGEVLDIDEHDNGVTLQTKDTQVDADLAILATGRCPDYDVFNLAGIAAERYFPLHIPGTRLDTIPHDAEVYVLGASLSAYDVVNQLFASSTGSRFVSDGPDRLRFEPHGNERRVVLCSRGSRLKKVKSRHPFQIRHRHFSLAALRDAGETASLPDIFDRMLQDAAEHGADIDLDEIANPYAGCETDAALNRRALELLERDIDAAASPADSSANFVVDYLDAVQMDLWEVFAAHILSPDDEALFRKHYESPLLTFAAPCPSQTAQKVLALTQAGRLRIVQGVSAVTPATDASSVAIEHRFGTDTAAYLVNASGIADRNVESERQPALIASLQRKGLLRPYSRLGGTRNGADVDLHSFRSASAKRIYVANMFLWGPGLYVSSAIAMATIVKQLLDSAFATSKA